MQSIRLDKTGKVIPAPGYKTNYNYNPHTCAYGQQVVPFTPVIDHLAQGELTALLSKYGFIVGDFVVSTAYAVNSGLLNKEGILTILEIERSAAEVKKPYKSYAPMPLLVTNFPGWTGTKFQGTPVNPYVRWTYCDLYRRVSGEEYDRLIKPDHDLLQNYIKQIREGIKAGVIQVAN